MRYARLAGLLLAPLLAAGCSTLDSLVPDSADIGIGSSMQPAKTTGLAVSDEPLAAQAGAAVLTQGGSAADAVTAMFFTLSATYPVAAGPGGGGICLVRDAAGHAREYDFLPHAAVGGGVYAVPGAVAGFYDLQKAYGSLPWQRLVAPGEAYAATGFPISHVLEQRIVSTQNIIRLDAALAAEFLDQSGQPKPEGTVVSNPDLSVTLGDIRLNGADGFSNSTVSAGLVAYARGEGGAISAGELSGYRSVQTGARIVNMGAISAALPGPTTGAGAFISSVIANVAAGSLDASVPAALRKSLAAFNIAAVPPDLGATGFAALDANGTAAACAVTLNGPFGSGHTAGATGVLLAAPPTAPAGIAGAFLTPIIASDRAGPVVLSGVGAGGPNGSAAIAYALLKLRDGQPLARPTDLRSTGLAPYVTVNVISCGAEGLCVAIPDPGGSGLGATAFDQKPTSN
jgi:gamma-glutamyltranspeptidase/glutathione hydrolase